MSPLLFGILASAGAKMRDWCVDDDLYVWDVISTHPVGFMLWSLACISAVVVWYMKRPQPIYLVDFACFKPGDDKKCNYELSEYLTRKSGKFTIPSVEFQRRIFLRSGLGEETYIPLFTLKEDPVPLYADATVETEQVMFGSVDDLLERTKVDPKEIGIVITNCSTFSPVPSFSAMLVNRYKLSESVKSIHLGGMGCSASVIACGLASDLLNLYRNRYALVVSTENVTLNWYFGNNKSMLVPNCLFRVGCSAILLTNKQSERSRSKYELLHIVRTHKAANDKAYRCAFHTEDDDGFTGVALNKDLMGAAADAMRTNLRALGPLVLPFSEQAFYVFNSFCRNVFKMRVKQYQPNFKLAFQHFSLHAGGRAVIDEIAKNLLLGDYLTEPSRATLHRFGNTSASFVWYVLAYMEAKERIKKDEKVCMIGLGSGFKCNSAVWKAIDDMPLPMRNPWLDCIHRYPIAMSNTAPASASRDRQNRR